AELLQRMVELRTVMGEARRSAELIGRVPPDEELCAEEETRVYLRGLAELFDFAAGGPFKPEAKRLNPELDLSEFSDLEVVAYLEARQQATSIHPKVGAWIRALVSRHVQISEFLRYRRPGREVRPDRVEEVLQFSQVAIGALLEAEERYRAEL